MRGMKGGGVGGRRMLVQGVVVQSVVVQSGVVQGVVVAERACWGKGCAHV